MADASTLARPYAQAIFEVAKESGQFAPWSERLTLISSVVADPQMKALISSPRVERDQLAGLVNDVCGDRLDDNARNLVRLLAQNRRLGATADVAEQFEELRAEEERVVEAELQTAVEIDESQRDRFAKALEKRLGRSVKLVCTTNPDLLGGAVVRAGDMVIDGSVKAQLQKLAGAISA